MFGPICVFLLAVVFVGYVLAMSYVSGDFATYSADTDNEEQEVPTHFVSVNGRIY